MTEECEEIKWGGKKRKEKQWEKRGGYEGKSSEKSKP